MGGRRRCRGDEARGWQVGPQRRQPIILFLLSLMTVEQVTVSSKGQITIPKALRDMLSLSPGAKLSVSVRGPEIVLSKEPAWKSLRGAGEDTTPLHERHQCEIKPSHLNGASRARHCPAQSRRQHLTTSGARHS